MTLLDGSLIRRRRQELGLSARAVAKAAGMTSSAVLANIEAGTNHPDLPLGLVARLADVLAVDIATLIHQPHTDDGDGTSSDSGDTATLGAVLHTIDVHVPVSVLCDSLGWDRARLDRAVEVLQRQLKAAGLRLHTTENGCRIVRGVEDCDPAALRRAVRAHIARNGLNHTEASLLARIRTSGLPAELRNADAVALRVLINAELVAHDDTDNRPDRHAPTVAAEAVRYALMLDEHPDDPLPPPSARRPAS